MDTILETQRLLLRFQRRSDISALVDLWSDEKVTRYLGGPRDHVMLRTVFEETADEPAAEKYDLWPLVEKSTGQLVGHCGLLDKDIEGEQWIELTYILHPAAWGKGYACEIGEALIQYAFREWGLETVIAFIHPENTASERTAIRLGMSFDRELTRPGGAVRKLYLIQRQA